MGVLEKMKMVKQKLTENYSNLRNYATKAAVVVALTGCAGMQRSCSSCSAESFATDWVVVQYKYDGEPMNCWKLSNTSIANEQGSDGIYWVDSKTRNLVHISGWYNRVQVESGQWKEAADAIGIDLERCVSGKYKAKPSKDQ